MPSLFQLVAPYPTPFSEGNTNSSEHKWFYSCAILTSYNIKAAIFFPLFEKSFSIKSGLRLHIWSPLFLRQQEIKQPKPNNTLVAARLAQMMSKNPSSHGFPRLHVQKNPITLQRKKHILLEERAPYNCSQHPRREHVPKTSFLTRHLWRAGPKLHNM